MMLTMTAYHYNHGNDSGWDNSTIFSKGAPVESPDLSAFLIIQMEALANMARQLERWTRQGIGKRNLRRPPKYARTFWKGDRFVARISGSHECIDTQSLQLFIPIVLGNRFKGDNNHFSGGTKGRGQILTPMVCNREYRELLLYT